MGARTGGCFDSCVTMPLAAIDGLDIECFEGLCVCLGKSEIEDDVWRLDVVGKRSCRA